MGIRRKGELQFMVNWLANDEPTHDATDGLLDAWAEGSKDQYDVLFPDGSNFLGLRVEHRSEGSGRRRPGGQHQRSPERWSDHHPVTGSERSQHPF
jgi:hypothetical protein